MEQLATPGSTRLTADTLRLAEGLVQVNALGRFPVKGLAEPVEVFQLVGASTIRRRLQASAARGLTRFVGRQQELATLQQALERAGTGHGQVVAVVGEAGVGKSRLAYEFVHAHHTSGWLVLESASVSYGKATPYFPVIDLLKRYCHVEEHDDARTMRAKVTGQVLTLDLALQDTVPALLALLEALPEDSPFLQLDPPQRRQRTLDALKQVLLRESQVQPLLLVVEDLHWIDTETQALLDRLVESIPTARLLLLVNYRPEYQHGWSNKTFYTQLRLDPLPPASADALLQALLGDNPSLAPLQQLLIAMPSLHSLCREVYLWVGTIRYHQLRECMGMERRLAAIFSTDGQGDSRPMGEDEVATIRTIIAYRELMASLIQQHRGRVVDSPGDNLLAEFASVVEAVQCAVAIQQELKVRNAELSPQRRMAFRIGINLGDVV